MKFLAMRLTVMLSCCGSIVLLLAIIPSGCQGGNVLVYPIEGSHWLNMDILIQALHSKGHNITIVRSNKSWYIKEHSPHYNAITVKSERSLDQEFVRSVIQKAMEYQRGLISLMDFINFNIEIGSKLFEIHNAVSEVVTAMLDDHKLMDSIEESKYDLVITDPCWGGGTILAKYLNLPLVYNVRWLSVGEGHFAIAPSPVSYVPMVGSGFTDKMTFFERVKNMIIYVFTEIQHIYLIESIYQKICDKYLSPYSKFYQLMQAADLWLMRVDFVLDFPRPTMPNVIYIGGFQCKPAKPLPQDLEEFVQNSGEHGFILMSLGTFIDHLDLELSETIAHAFAQLPQRVIWRYHGVRPARLGNNTLLVDWMPQNDLLGHAKIKLFVAHGGTNGVQEAIYHGIPVLGMPIFFDQFDNLLRLRERGAAKVLGYAQLTTKVFFEAIQEVLQEPSYRLNMQRLSKLHRDQPMKPLDSAIFWIEYVMRHKGAAHLRTESYRMPWYAYHSIDVMLFLLGVTLLIFLLMFVLLKCLFIGICCKQKIKQV